MMAHSTLEEMNAIEVAAKNIYQDYINKIEVEKSAIDTKLHEASQQYDLETKSLVDQAKRNYQSVEQKTNIAIKEKVAESQSQLQNALNEKKELLMTQIVEKVVEKYGN